ncbi:hypothetical protein evm_007931 [Chilo suppressalis]|nr:hypothetical protein evm_007931 [Chilo suppressalis]
MSAYLLIFLVAFQCIYNCSADEITNQRGDTSRGTLDSISVAPPLPETRRGLCLDTCTASTCLCTPDT